MFSAATRCCTSSGPIADTITSGAHSINNTHDKWTAIEFLTSLRMLPANGQLATQINIISSIGHGWVTNRCLSLPISQLYNEWREVMATCGCVMIWRHWSATPHRCLSTSVTSLVDSGRRRFANSSISRYASEARTHVGHAAIVNITWMHHWVNCTCKS